MSRTSVDDLVSLNDPKLESLIRSGAEDRETEIERVITSIAHPLAAAITSRMTLSASPAGALSVEDILATIDLRVVAKLRALVLSPDEAVRDFENYVATLSYNTIHDALRRAFPARARLKNRLRYALTHHPKLALWTVNDALIGGLHEWRGATDALSAVPPQLAPAPDPRDTGGALVQLFRAIGRPVLLDGLVAAVAVLWNVADVPPREVSASLAESTQPDAAAQIEDREYLIALWREIKLLRPMQRKALLLNLRSRDSEDGAWLLVLTGVAPYDELAEALEMSPRELTEIWNELPLDDLNIASRLSVTRQQVINLRKSARERLARRVPR